MYVSTPEINGKQKIFSKRKEILRLYGKSAEWKSMIISFELNGNLEFIDTEAIDISRDFLIRNQKQPDKTQPVRSQRDARTFVHQANLRRCVFMDAKLPRAVLLRPFSVSFLPFDVEVTTPARL